jgi:hypothetical protein
MAFPICPSIAKRAHMPMVKGMASIAVAAIRAVRAYWRFITLLAP